MKKRLIKAKIYLLSKRLPIVVKLTDTQFDNLIRSIESNKYVKVENYLLTSANISNISFFF